MKYMRWSHSKIGVLLIGCVIVVLVTSLAYAQNQKGGADEAGVMVEQSTMDTVLQEKRKALTREELLAQEWDALSNDTIGIVSRILDDNGHITSEIISITDKGPGDTIVRVDVGKVIDSVRRPEQEYIAPLAVNDFLNEIYVGVGYSGPGSTRELFPTSYLYAINYNNEMIRLLTERRGQSYYQRLAPDKTTYSYISLEEAEGNQKTSTQDDRRGIAFKTRHMFTIVDLLSGDVTTLPVPGDAMVYALAHEEQFANPASVKNYISAYQFIDTSTVEFVRYYTYLDDSTEKSAETRVSDKELWSYNRTSGKMTLLETMPYVE